jgi:hypothetical protein
MPQETLTTTERPNRVRFRLEPFADSDEGVIIEMRAFEEGPRGGCGREIGFPESYWRGLVSRLGETSCQ